MSIAPTLFFPAILPPEPVHRFTVPEYHRMIQTGILSTDETVELLEGWIVPKMTRNPPHDLSMYRCQRVMFRVLPPEVICFGQSAITTADSEPEPDLAIVPGPDERYANRHPAPDEVLLAIEVADTSLARDRGLKARVYARAGVPIYWIVNLNERQVEVYSDPIVEGSTATYRARRDYPADAELPLVLSGVEIARIPVRDLLS